MEEKAGYSWSVAPYKCRSEHLKSISWQTIPKINEHIVLPGQKLMQCSSGSRVDDLSMAIGSGARKDSSGTAIESRVYGIFCLVTRKEEGPELRVIIPAETGASALEYRLAIYPTIGGEWPPVSSIEAIIRDSKFLWPLSPAEIEIELSKFASGAHSPGETMLLAQGTPSVDDVKEHFVLLRFFEGSIGELNEHGEINYRERKSFCSVKKGEKIAKRVKQVDGAEGTNVYGEIISFKERPPESSVFLKSGFTVDESDENLFVAAHRGVLRRKEGTIWIDEVLNVSGDVDFNSGNIDFDGHVLVEGSVREGFSVKATGDVTIRGNVDSGRVTCDGNIFIGNGIIGRGIQEDHHFDGSMLEPEVVAGKGLTAEFVQHAVLAAGDFVTIRGSALSSMIFAKGKIAVDGNAIGGAIFSRSIVKIRRFGAPAGTRGYIAAGKDPILERDLASVSKELTDAKREMQETMVVLDQYFGTNWGKKNLEVILKRFPPSQKKAAVENIKKVLSLKKIIPELTVKLDVMKKEATAMAEHNPHIEIVESIYPDTEIVILGRRHMCRQPIKGGTIFKLSLDKTYVEQKI